MPSPLVQPPLKDAVNVNHGDGIICHVSPSGSEEGNGHPDIITEADNDDVCPYKARLLETPRRRHNACRVLQRFYTPTLSCQQRQESTLLKINKVKLPRLEEKTNAAGEHSYSTDHAAVQISEEQVVSLEQETLQVEPYPSPWQTALSERLGCQGGFGSVYIGSFNGKPAAIKRLHKSKNDHATQHSFCAELNAFGLNHPNIVKILTFCCFNESVEVVCEYAGPHNLQQLLRNPSVSLSPEKKQNFCKQIACALDYCHSNGILHLDVKTSNVLVCEKQELCKLGDFGCSMKISSSEKFEPSRDCCSTIPGTLIYRCPELLRGQPPTMKADVYSFGILIWECVYQQVPFEGLDPHTVVFCVVAKQLRPVILVTMITNREKKLLDIAQECWDEDAEKRPTFNQICSMLQSHSTADQPAK
ncbi:serine:threonine protein kinase mos [Trichuris trichiura]|uniref:Serine:threonine protein kinase mos n=1 Tax=Trichuris trichiura TaxID=36087 RepID=A0A077Z961_TRITR|nr:serine:threonine protein kinase mos [Trichuris trichiura]